MPITTTTRPVNPNNTADLNFCVTAAAAAGLHWDQDTARSYATDPDMLLGLLLGTWPERGINTSVRLAVIQNSRNKDGAGGTAKGWLLAIDPSRIPDLPNNAGGRLKIVDHIMESVLARAAERGTAKLEVSSIPNVGTKIHGYLATLPMDSKIVGPTHTDYVFDVAAIRAAINDPGRTSLYGGA